ncbi:hypothetical protein [Nannocystis pusilla]|uniref:hypothetical protein n=1 Tax=Nannocystis pusilla TaxID=889268 RepID=UPI003B7D3F71
MTHSRVRTLFTDLRTWLFALALAPLAAVACGGGEESDDAGDGPEIDCATATAPKFSEMSAVWNKCTTCHSSTLTGASRVNAPSASTSTPTPLPRPTPRRPCTRSTRAPCRRPACPP